MDLEPLIVDEFVDSPLLLHLRFRRQEVVVQNIHMLVAVVVKWGIGNRWNHVVSFRGKFEESAC